MKYENVNLPQIAFKCLISTHQINLLSVALDKNIAVILHFNVLNNNSIEVVFCKIYCLMTFA